jgi:amino acid adenylation domain-containing protein/non-ribosomal peptide synthase protein (TIGR01720 family)
MPAMPGDRSGALSYAQRRLWFLEQLVPGNTVHSVPAARRLRGRLDVAALERALRRVAERQEVLRTRIRSDGGEPWLDVTDGSELRVVVEDLRGAAAGEREARRRTAEEARRPFDLAEGPLIRMLLLRLGDEEWVLQRTVHHIVSDAWSLELLWRELSECYLAEVEGREPLLPPLAMSYADYAAEQRRWMEGEAMAAQLAYWRERLRGAPDVLDLPTDRPRPGLPGHRAGWCTFPVPDEVTELLRALCRAERVTPYMALLAVFQSVLGRWTGHDDVLVGTPVSGRTRREIQDVAGLFSNLLVMRADLGGDPDFRELLRRTRRGALGAFANRALPFERLVDELRPRRDTDRNPLVQVLFQVLHGEREDLRMAGLEAGAFEDGELGGTLFDLELHVQDEGDAGRGLHGRLVYSRDLFGEATARRVIDHYQCLLRQVVLDPAARVWRLDLRTEGERRLVDAWSAAVPAPAPAGPATVHALFEEQVARRPDALALVAGEERLTYLALDRKANGLARRLRDLGVGAEDVVGVCLDRGAALPVALLGVLKAGAAYLPLDPAYPEERLAHVRRDAGCRVVVTERWLAELPARNGPEAEGRAPRVRPGNAAYVIYTSGSTGQPKGVAVSHASLANFLRAMAVRPGLGDADTLLAVTTVSFDIAALELFLPLVTGGRVVLADRETAMDGVRLRRELDACRATVMQATPVTWRMLLEAGWRPAPGFRALCGGEAMGEDLARALLERGVELWNLYGPTETTVWSSVEPVEEWTGITIGRPIASTRMAVLDRWLRPVPIGVAGELYIGGSGLARGYHGKPGLTAGRFLPDPAPVAGGERLYRTGDLARFLDSGKIEHLGRVDGQVKVRGFRVEPGEVEARLLQHPEVRGAVVVLRRDGAGDGRLVAYVVRADRSTGDLDVRALRGHLRERLPAYMVPAQFVELDALPLTPNGKVDRRRLPAPRAARPDVDEPVRPRTGTEARIAAIWESVLGLPRVGVHDDFFELGGDSMLAVRVAARVLSEVGVALPVRTIFQEPTVAGLASAVDTAPPAAGDPADAIGAAELTPGQQWIFRAARPDHGNVTALFQTPAGVDLAALERAVEAVLDLHDALRARFERADGRWRQIIPPPGPHPAVVSRVHLPGLPPATQRAELEARCARLQAGMDFERGPALRVVHFDLGPRVPGRLLLVVAHLLVDAYSFAVLLQDIATAYRQLGAGEGIVLPPKTTSFREFTSRLEAQAASAAVQEDLRYWLDLPWAEAGPLSLDLTADRSANTMASWESVTAALSEEETTGLLRTVVPALDVEVHDALSAALVHTVTGLLPSGWANVMVIAHRRDLDLGPGANFSRTVGCLAYGHPELLHANRHLAPRPALLEIAEQRRRAPRRGYTFEALQLLGPPQVRERMRGLPRPDIELNYMGPVTPWPPPPAGASLLLGPAREEPGPAFDPLLRRESALTYTIRIAGGRLTLQLGYSRDLHRRETVAELASDYVAWLCALIP